MICVPGRMNPSSVQRFTANSTEVVSTTIRVPNAGSIQIAVVYKCAPNNLDHCTV